MLELNNRIFVYKKYLDQKIQIPELENPFEESTSTDSFDPKFSILNEFYDKSKIKRIFKNIPLTKEILELRFNLLTSISKNLATVDNLNFHQNLSHEQINSLLTFSAEKPFLILQCDKNVGTCLISKQSYYDLASIHLNDSLTYLKLSENPLSNTVSKINNSIEALLNNKSISLKIYKKLILDPNLCKLGKFRILPKIHKQKFSTRPIINCIHHPTEKLCLFIDCICKFYVFQANSILKDSQNLLQICNNFSFNSKEVFLYSCDFESLYTNIRPSSACNLISEYLIQKGLFENNFEFNSVSFVKILSLIFENNIFSFNNDFYLQLIGLPMGCKCGPSVANLYLYILEKNWLSLNSTILYKRFIDDIFIASPFQIDLENLKEQFLYLNLNIVQDEKVNFLDLNIEFDFLVSKLKFSLYLKPTNSFSYLLPSSNHPKHIFTNVPKSLFLRIRRICSSYIDYQFYSRFLLKQLLKRGYDFKTLSGISREIGNLDRNTLIPYKKTINSINNPQTLKFFFTFNNSTSFISETFKSTFKKFYENSEPCQKPNLMFINTLNPNLGTYLLNNFKFSKFNKKFCKKCNFNCKVCNFLNNSFYINYHHISLPIQSFSNCLSLGIIYVIKCNLCKIFYIGQTSKNAKIRIGQHLNNILAFKKNLNKSLCNFYNCSEVAIHFSDKSHNLLNFSFYIFNSNIENNIERLSLENDLINTFLHLKIPLLNRKIPQINLISKFSFTDK